MFRHGVVNNVRSWFSCLWPGCKLLFHISMQFFKFYTCAIVPKNSINTLAQLFSHLFSNNQIQSFLVLLNSWIDYTNASYYLFQSTTCYIIQTSMSKHTCFCSSPQRNSDVFVHRTDIGSCENSSSHKLSDQPVSSKSTREHYVINEHRSFSHKKGPQARHSNTWPAQVLLQRVTRDWLSGNKYV